MRLISFIGLLFFSGLLLAQSPNTWTKKADFAGLKRTRAVAFTLDGKGYVGTGIDTAEIVRKDFWAYDPGTDTWSQIADLPGSVRRDAIAFTVEPYGYVGSGIDSVTASTPSAQKLNDFWRYDKTTNSWTQIASIPGPGVYFATGFAIDSKGYLCCGKFGPNYYSNQLWEYKPAIDQWTQLASFPGGVRYQLASFTIGYKAYVGLGTDQDIYRKDIWEFDATTNSWNAKNDLPASERSATMTFSIGNRGYVCMGADGGYLGDLWEYNPDIDDWTAKAPYVGSSRKGGVGFAINGKGYVGTGKGYSGKKQSFWEYTPQEVVGLEEFDTGISIYPNPAKDQIQIKGNISLFRQIKITNTYGQVIREFNNLDHLTVEGLTSGTYYLELINGQNNTIREQFVKL